MLGKTKFIAAGILVAILLAAGIGGNDCVRGSLMLTPTIRRQDVGGSVWQAFAQSLALTVEKAQQAETDAVERCDQPSGQARATDAGASRCDAPANAECCTRHALWQLWRA